MSPHRPRESGPRRQRVPGRLGSRRRRPRCADPATAKATGQPLLAGLGAARRQGPGDAPLDSLHSSEESRRGDAESAAAAVRRLRGPPGSGSFRGVGPRHLAGHVGAATALGHLVTARRSGSPGRRSHRRGLGGRQQHEQRGDRCRRPLPAVAPLSRRSHRSHCIPRASSTPDPKGWQRENGAAKARSRADDSAGAPRPRPPSAGCAPRPRRSAAAGRRARSASTTRRGGFAGRAR